MIFHFIRYFEKDHVSDPQCSRKYKSGWWFPLRVYSSKHFPKKNDRQGNCDFDVQYDTNLNGIYNKEEDLNNRTIAVCDLNQSVEDCFVLHPNGIYEFKGSIVKLAETKIFLGHPLIVAHAKRDIGLFNWALEYVGNSLEVEYFTDVSDFISDYSDIFDI